ncbi:uncharacterized protein At5g19025-like [Nymphaea colorata]|uniref:uncharacterized protein At5g19025-like n=1 Tax=Nymphaea colorata TaxID=210225 RepID=UPI00129E268C|nr:uncharacterized protein At5g19025-like [Nymphaea colorata]XP_031493635.1 uncharacterized protein At5g19025-like [Nymphaea colorata]XP_049935444.1 uncharacterized protein At5g19025-like [Nymphaea colorata]
MPELSMVDCRGLIEFCRAFEQHKNSLAMSDHHRNGRSRRPSGSLNPLALPLCDQSPFAALDIIILLIVLGALGVLVLPYFRFICHEAAEIFPAAILVMGEVMYHVPVAYVTGAIAAFVIVVVAWEFLHHKARKCGKPYCKGLRKAVEFDIQLESEECVKSLPSVLMDAMEAGPLELGRDHKELEAELKRMAPLNGRAVLIFRAPCGCPAGRMEVWGPKKLRKVKR